MPVTWPYLLLAYAIPSLVRSASRSRAHSASAASMCTSLGSFVACVFWLRALRFADCLARQIARTINGTFFRCLAREMARSFEKHEGIQSPDVSSGGRSV
jgi:hypothetical protein